MSLDSTSDTDYLTGSLIKPGLKEMLILILMKLPLKKLV